MNKAEARIRSDFSGIKKGLKEIRGSELRSIEHLFEASMAPNGLCAPTNEQSGLMIASRDCNAINGVSHVIFVSRQGVSDPG